MGYATGKHAYGFCDRCSFRYPLKQLKEQFEAGARTNLMVCPTCWEEDNPQDELGKIPLGPESQALYRPRPDKDIVETRSYNAFNPVGGGLDEFGSRTVGLDIFAVVGDVTVEVT
jgi:hypothetical protein